MKLITIIQGIRVSPLIRLVFRHGITPLPLYLARFLVLFQGALISSLFALVERAKFRRKIRRFKPVKDPLFIIGHWRTGSTFLHQLLNLDPSFAAPTLVQTVIPDHFLFSTKYYRPILRKATSSSRPMDNVALGPDEPQEEEFALLRMGSASPLEHLIFPSRTTYFLSDYDQYIPHGKDKEKWERNLRNFYCKLTFSSGKRIVSKNPCHTMRIRLLAEMFPDAKFIHIVRDPLKVIPSTARMWDIVARESGLKKGWITPGLNEVALVLRQFLRHVEEEKKLLDKGSHAEVRFEDLEDNPLQTLKRLYEQLGLDFSPGFEKAVVTFLEGIGNYEKNTYTLSSQQRSQIMDLMNNRVH